ncbi:pikachurin-like [Anopheles stephensi]|uniref:pikachurin-like n=1 Tax=Anopheles stephensi TaxID=30069 RepID=UPI001658A9D0|nr:pikachurin-like [Anopheles stephensi]
MMAFGSLRCRTVLVLLVFCAVHPKATAPQEAGTIQRESIDLQKCGINNPALPKIVSRVTEGEIAIEGYWPWHGGLFHLNDYQCGCTLINELFVLTASHCVYNGDTGYRISEKLVRVKLGMHRLSANDSSSLQTFTVQKIIPHSKFVPNSHKHDVALLRLNGTVSFTNYVQPVCLDLTETIWVEYLADVIGTVVGWGITEKNRISDQLLQAELPIVRYTDCVESNPELYGRLIYSGMYCAGILNGTSPCNGDSGGGMYIKRDKRWFLRGVVSFSAIREGTNYCDSFSYVVFMNVPYYAKWIEQEVDTARAELLKASTASVSTRWDSDRNEDYEEDNIYSLRMEMESDSPQAMPRMGPERTAVRKRTVRCGQGVTLSCKRSAGLAQKKIHWYKAENGSRTFLIENETLVYRDVRYHHAGEYWCQVTSDTGTLYETGLELTVTSVPIRFQQSEYISYAVHDTLLDTQLSTQFSFEMTFRTSESNALLFHKPPVAGVESWTFSLLLERNRLTLRIVPPGQLEKVFRSVRLQLQPTRWHTVLVSSYDGQGLMALDGQYLLGFEGHLVQQRADRFYIANAPGLRTPGFSGCVSRLMVNDKVLHLDRDFSHRVNVVQCEFCYSEECNMGRCPGGQQHSCINYGCIDQGRQCDGPVGLMPEGDCSDFGPEPSTLGLRFQNNSYVSYRSFLRVVLTVDLQFQLHGLTDGVVLHTAEHRRGFGKFITILVKAGRIEMRFTTDAHLHTIYLESTVKLLTGRWYRLQAGYRDGYVYVQVDKEQEVARSILGTVFPIDRQLVVFVGGVRWAGFINRHRDVKQGLDGCIKELKLSGLPVDLVDDMVESANIRSCQDERR